MTITREELGRRARPRLPLPGAGDTFGRWEALAEVGREDLSLAKLVEPHHDAVAILHEICGVTDPDGTWAVWAAEPPFARLSATGERDGWRLDGSKAFCSGADLVTHALVTADVDGRSGLFAVGLDDPGIRSDPEAPPWVGAGMADARTTTLRFTSVRARQVGSPGDYVDRPGFWHGAVGVAAVWWGGAQAVADVLERSRTLDAHGLAHRGSVRAALHATEAVLRDAAREIDRLPDQPCEPLAQGVRAVTAACVDTVLRHVGRATGPGPLAFDPVHTRRVADLTVFVRQHHAERDLQRLGELELDA